MPTFKWADIDAAAKEAWKDDLDRVMTDLTAELGEGWERELMEALIASHGKDEP